MNEKELKGRLILSEVTFDKIWNKNVTKNNKSSGKVTLPKELIGKKVYVILKKK